MISPELFAILELAPTISKVAVGELVPIPNLTFELSHQKLLFPVIDDVPFQKVTWPAVA